MREPDMTIVVTFHEQPPDLWGNRYWANAYAGWIAEDRLIATTTLDACLHCVSLDTAMHLWGWLEAATPEECPAQQP